MNERAALIHCARVYVREAAARRRSPLRHQRQFGVTLLRWAANARRQAAAIDTRPVQGDLFEARVEAAE